MKKNLATILVIIGFLAAFGGIVWLGQPRTGQKADLSSSIRPLAEVFSASESFYDFGTISMAKGKVTRSFKVKNVSDKAINAEKLYTSCMCTTATFAQKGATVGPFGMPGHGFVPPLKKSIAPGEEIEIVVVFDPSAHGPAGVGRIERSVYLENNLTEPLILNIAATVTP